MNSANKVVGFSQEPGVVLPERASSLSIVTNDANMARAVKLAELMASSNVTVPKHLQNNVGDCLAIAMQAMNFGMDAFVVAQKTHLVNGVLGYEAQLVNAIVQSSNAIRGAFSYEYKDEGGTGASAYVTCRVGAVLNGQKDITWGEWLPSSNVTTKNSPLWKTNVKQQMGYLQVKNWARLYCPAAIMGVYSVDELQDMPAPEKDITPVVAYEKPAPIYYSDEEFTLNENAWKKVIANGKSPADFMAFIESKGKLFTDNQKAEIMLWAKKPQVVEGEATAVQDDFTADYEKTESAGQ